MNRRISKDMAHDAAIKMGRALYDSQINDATEALTRFADDCVIEVIPMPVRQVIEEFYQYFACTKSVIIACGNHSIPAKSTIKVPASYYYLDVKRTEYEQGKRLYNELQRLTNTKKKFIEDTTNLLYRELKYEKRVAEVVPEVLSYIVFPEVVAPPARTLYYEQLNTVLSNIKKSKK